MRPFALTFLFAIAFVSFGQEVIIDENYVDKPLTEVIDDLRDKYQLKLAFSRSAIEGIRVSVDIRKEKLSKALDVILSKSGLEYELISDDAVLIRKARPKDTLGETYSITGSIYDAQSGERMPFAHVYTTGGALSTTSNEYGVFTLSGLSDSTKVNVSFLGYGARSFKISPSQSNQRVKFELVPLEEMLDELVVNETNSMVESEALGTATINPRMYTNLPSTAERDPVRMSQLLPGVNATAELSVGPEIQGGTSNQNAIIFDGFTVYHLDHFFGYFSAINPYAVKHQQIFKSGFGAKYGGGASGIMQFVGKDGSSDEISGRLSVNQLSLNSSLEIPISKSTTLFASARRSYSDFLKTSLFDRVFNLYEQTLQDEGQYGAPVSQSSYDPEFSFNDLNFKVSTSINPRMRFSMSLYSSQDKLNFDESVRLSYPSDSTINIYGKGFVEWGNLGASVRLARYWNRKHFTELFVSYSGYQSNFDKLQTKRFVKQMQVVRENSITDLQNNRIQDFSIDLEHEWHFSNVFIETGLHSTFYSSHINSKFGDTTIIDKRQHNIGLFSHYFQSTIDVSQNTQVGAGLRTNFLQGLNEVTLEPRFSFRQQLSDNITFKAATGIHRQFINQIVTTNTLQGSRDLWVVADDEVPDQRSWHVGGGFEMKQSKSSYEIGFFYKDFSGLMDYAFTQGVRTTEYENYEEHFFEGIGFSRGAEAMYHFKDRNFQGMASYTFKWIKYNFDDRNGGDWFFADHDQRHEVSLFGMYEAGVFDFSGTWYFGSGVPYTEYLPQVIATERPVDGQGNTAPTGSIILRPIESKNSHRFNAYHRLDFGINYTKEIGENELIISANLINAFDRTNYYARELRYETPDSPNNQNGTEAAFVNQTPNDQGHAEELAVNFNISSLPLISRTFSLGVEVKF